MYAYYMYLLVPCVADAWPLATPLPTKPLGRNAPAVARPAANTPTVAVLILDESFGRRCWCLVLLSCRGT